MKNSSLYIVLHRMRQPFLVIIITFTIAVVGLLIIDGVDNEGNIYKFSIFDAFYFVTYTATTIGFGETPYAFTYAQKLWVTFSIYLTVLGWFYAIGTLITLFQDKLFLREIKKAKFKRQIKSIKEKFIIVLGYNQVTSEIINRSREQGIRTVVIEKDEFKANNLILENFTPNVPILMIDSYNATSLKEAGLKSFYCRGLVCIFENDSLNLRMALTAKLINPYVKLAVKSTTSNHTENLKDLDVEIIANPFSIISTEISMALTSPNLLKLEKWIYKIEDLNINLASFPKGKYIICGYGRMGEDIYAGLKKHGIEVEFIEINRSKVKTFHADELMHITYGNADDKEVLLKVGIKDAVAIISSTNDDTTNLSILATAKKLNPDIMTIARENDIEDFSIFQSAKIDHIFMPSIILINKITNALISPLSDEFIRLLYKENDKWAALLIKDLIQTIDVNPLLYELKINKKYAPEVFNVIKEKKEVKLGIFTRSLYNKEQKNNVIPLLLIRDDETVVLPSLEVVLQEDDKILFACNENARNDIEYISLNVYEFYYAYTGEERKTLFSRKNQ